MIGLDFRRPENPGVRRRTFRAVRRARGLTSVEASQRLDIPKRTYQYLESGRARLDLRRLQHFAVSLDVDPLAVLLAMMLDRPNFAERVANTHLISVVLGLCGDLEMRLGDTIARLDGPTVHRSLSAAFDNLARQAESRTFR